MRTLPIINPTSEQLKILNDTPAGIRLIRGAAGSGKTTVAILRLRQLIISRWNQRARADSEDPVRVLVLTFNRTLRGYISQLASEQVDVKDGVVLEVETFGRWARRQLGRLRILDEEECRRWIRSNLNKADIPSNDQEYFIDEVRYVQGRFTPSNLELYLDATRTGRGRAPAVPRALRHNILKQVIEPYQAMKAEKGVLDWNDVAHRVSGIPCLGYDVVVVDESQDLSANQIRAVLAHLSERHATTFIIDAMQRIYPQGFQWNEVGIEMRPGMVISLARNYRNTKEIARFASSLVQGLPTDADGVLPDERSCAFSGVRPLVVVGVYSAQLRFMLNQIQPRLQAGETVAILQPRGGGWLNCVRNTLQQWGIGFCELTRSSEWPTGPELLAISTIHSAKGLEFDHVLMPGLSSEVTPHGTEEGDGTLESVRRLVAMGVGRAKKSVMLGYKPGERSTVFDYIESECYDLVEV